MAAFAIVISEKGGGERRQVFDKDEIHVGRIQSNDLMLPKGNVSKRHATLSFHEGRFVVRDENSTNGTYVNRRRISQATIVRQGDRIYVGDFILRIETPSEAELVAHTSQVPERRSPQPTGLDFADKTVKTSADNIPRPPGVPQGLAPSEVIGSATTTLEEDADALRSQPDASARPPPESDAPRRVDAKLTGLVGQLVMSVFRKLEPGLLEKESTDAVRQRVNRLLNEQALALERRGGFEGGPERERVVEAAQEELLDLGPLAHYLADDDVQHIAVTTDQRILIWDRTGYLVTSTAFSLELSLRWAIGRLCRLAKPAVAPEDKIIERELPNGWTLEASLSPDETSSFLVLSRPSELTLTLGDLVERQEMSRKVASFLEQCIEERRNLLIVSLPGTDAQPLLGALAFVCQDDPLVIVERRKEVLPGAAAIRLRERLGTALKEELKLACRLRGARLVAAHFGANIGCQVLAALSEGCSGALLATSARSAEAALELKAAELLVASPGMRGPTHIESMRRWLSSLVDLVVEVGTLADGRRRVLRVSELLPGENELRDVVRFVVERPTMVGLIEGKYLFEQSARSAGHASHDPPYESRDFPTPSADVDRER